MKENRLPFRFLKWFCPPELYESIEGDLLEQLESDIKEFGEKKAKRRFAWHVVKFFRPGIILRNRFSIQLINTMMLRNYITVAYRSLWRSKVHSFINVAGLGLGIACCILIALFVKDEWTFDRFHTKADRIYRVWAHEDWGENQVFFYTTTPFPMGPTLKENFPDVEHQVRINSVRPQVKVGDDQFTERVTFAGQDFFEVFDFAVTTGDSKQALRSQANVVLAQRIAKKYFGDDDPVGKTISIALGDTFDDFTVSAVTEDPPVNSSIRFDILISDLNYPRVYAERTLTTQWFNITPETYVLLREGAHAKELESKFPALFKTLIGEEDFTKGKYTVGLQPLTSIHLDTSFPAGIAPVSDPRYSYILATVALLILLVACINFITLSVGRSIKRAKEVGIRKVVGAVRKQLMTQFIGEAMLVTLMALLIGLGLAVLNLPLFNDLSGKQLSFPLDGFMAGMLIVMVFIIGIFSGSYPAFILSAFKPVAVLKGTGNPKTGKQTLRKILVGTQLVLSVSLVSSTLVMRDQLSYLQNKNLGFDKEQLAVVQLNVSRIPGLSRLSERIVAGFEKVTQFKNELSGIPGITGVCGSSHDFANGNWVFIGYTDDNGTYRTFYFNTVEPDYFDLLNIELASGRGFDKDNPSDARRGLVINEAFAKELGWDNPVGKRIPGKKFPDHEVIGVVKDFNYESLYTKVKPMALVMDPMIVFAGTENVDIANSPIPKLLIKLEPGNMAVTIEQVKQVWKKLTGGEEFAFSFVDERLAAQYASDQNLGKIIGIATLLAILIGSLGLYGLASLAMQSRTKEIGIRKVLGATERSLLVLLSKEYVYLVAVSLLLSVPVTWYLMMQWLQAFEYRVAIGWQHFAFAGGISLLVALITISYQTIKTAWVQPADTLKYE
ncbi:MAG: ABC transporter permease [Cyclobacteriaceae bacterium]|nr:ABC transporter permease [Cyclobacteriaceae bacterium]